MTGEIGNQGINCSKDAADDNSTKLAQLEETGEIIQIKEKTEAATGMQDHFDLHKANFTGFWERVWALREIELEV